MRKEEIDTRKMTGKRVRMENMDGKDREDEI